MRRLLPIALTIAAVAGPVLTQSACAQDKTPAISPPPPSTPPIEPGAHITADDLETLNAQMRTDEDRLTARRDPYQHRGNGVIADTRVALNFNPYPHGPRFPNFPRMLGWRKPKQ